MEQLTKENYKDNHDYLSFSTLSRYMTCEAAAKAHYYEPTSEAMLVSSYVDSYFSGDLEQFKEENPSIFKKDGTLGAKFVQAEEIIQRIESDETFMHFLSGEKQVIMSGEIDGVPFKIKMDSYKPGEFITDLKVMKDFNKAWSDNSGRYETFIKAYNYDIELALFQEIVRQNTGKLLPCYLACITKESPSDIGIVHFSQDELNEALRIARGWLPRIKGIREGKIAPHRCNKCAYCRATKKATIFDSDTIAMNGDQLRENGIECEDSI